MDWLICDETVHNASKYLSLKALLFKGLESVMMLSHMNRCSLNGINS